MLPNIDAANIAYNLLKTAAGGGIAIGPVLLGAAKPVHILTPSATVRRIVNMTALTVADANAATRPCSDRRQPRSRTQSPHVRRGLQGRAGRRRAALRPDCRSTPMPRNHKVNPSKFVSALPTLARCPILGSGLEGFRFRGFRYHRVFIFQGYPVSWSGRSDRAVRRPISQSGARCRSGPACLGRSPAADVQARTSEPQVSAVARPLARPGPATYRLS